MRIRFEGSIPLGVYPKDLILHLIGTIGANGGIGYAVEFAGSAIRSMPIEGRLTPGSYTVSWQAASGDGHPIRGSFDFTFASRGASQASAPAAPTTSRDHSSHR